MRTPRSNNHVARSTGVRWRATGVALLCVVIGLATAGAAAPSRDSTAAPTGQVWALALPNSVKTVSQAQVDWLASKGVTAIVASKLPPNSLRQLTASARRANVIVIAPRPAVPRTACASTAGTLRTCAAAAGTPTAAVKLARRSLVDYVIVRVRSLQGLRMLRGSGAGRSRIVALLPLNKAAAWRAGIGYAAADRTLDLGVSSSPAAPGRLGGYLSLLPRVKSTRQADSQAPTVPKGMAFSGRTKTTVSLVWKAARDNVRVAGYRLFRNGVRVATKATPGYTYKGLKCGTRYTFSLVAYDSAGNTSRRAEATGSTSTAACTGGSPPPPTSPPPVAGATIQPGQSWQSAYAAAAANSSLNVAAGNHGAQSLSGDKKVTFVGASGAILHELNARASNITVDNVDIDGNAAKVTILNNSGDNNTYKNLEIRNNTDIQMITNAGSSATYENVSFHDAVMTTAGQRAGAHMECMWSSGPSLTVRNSVFRDCSVMDLFLTRGSWYGQGNVCCVTLENNIFFPSERSNNGGVHFYSVLVHENADSIDRYVIKNNRFDLPFSASGNPVVNSVFCGNTGRTERWWAPKC